MEERFDIIEQKLDQVFDELQDIRAMMCERDLDNRYFNSISSFDQTLRYLRNPYQEGKNTKLNTLKKHCEDPNTAPFKYLGYVNEMLSGRQLANCWEEIKTKVDYRIGLYRRIYVTMILNGVIRAAEYQHICYGMSTVNRNQGEMEKEMTEIYEKLQSYENEMRNSGEWVKSVKKHSEYKDCNTAECLYEGLRADFDPDHYDYDVYEISSKNSDNWDTNDQQAIYGGEGSSGKGQGSFTVGKFVVFFREKSKPAIGPLPSWRNTVCPNDGMCFKKVRECSFIGWPCWDECKGQHCHQSHALIGASQQHNPNAFNEYFARGTVIIRKSFQRYQCTRTVYDPCCYPIDGQCQGCERCVQDDWITLNRAGIASRAGDRITQVIETGAEQPRGSERSFYIIVGLAS